MLGKAIFNKLSSDVTVTGYVSTRIYPQLSPNQKDYPVIVYDITDVNPTVNSTGAVSFTESSVDIVVMANSYETALTISESVKAALHNQKRYLGWRQSGWLFL